jgi:hypothetical protein
LSIPSVEPNWSQCKERLATNSLKKALQPLGCPIAKRGGRGLASPSPFYVTVLRDSGTTRSGRLLQPFEEGRIGWTIDLEQAKGALFGAEERVVNRHKRTGHFAFEFSDGRFTRPHQGALDRFKRRF